MAWRAEQLGRRAALDEAAGVHHEHLVGALASHPEIVGDQDERHASLALQTGDEIEHLPLGGDVERRGGFVADEHERVAREAGGERDTLAHASRQLERIHRRDALGKVDLGESPTHLVVHLVTCHGERGGDLRAASVDGTQARERVLQQQADTSSAHRGERPGPTGEVEARAVDRHRPLGVHA